MQSARSLRHRTPISHDLRFWGGREYFPESAFTANTVSSIQTLTTMKNVYLSGDEVFFEELRTGASFAFLNRAQPSTDGSIRPPQRILRNLSGETPYAERNERLK
jgi:hypothetical protein